MRVTGCFLEGCGVGNGLTGHFPAAEGGFTAFVEEIPGAISQGERLEEARENLADALRMVLECNWELA